MPLARIISRSPQCSRELALDLLTRGYAVEVVSPDAIPDNFADLELRVEADPSNDLTANVAVHDGEHSTSFNFVHHLKAPMADFVRRPPETGQALYFPESPVSFNSEPGLFDEIELPPEVSEQALPPAKHALKFLSGPEEGVGSEQVLLPAKESEEERVRRSGITITIHRSQIKPKLKVTLKVNLKPKPTKASGKWFLRIAACVAAGAVLAIVLARGVRRDGGAPAVQSSPAVSSGTAATEKANVFSLREPQRPTIAAAGSPVPGPRQKRAKALRKPVSSKRPSVPSNSGIESSLRKADDLSTPDAAVYRDKPIAQASKSTRHHKRRRRHDDGLVANDTVTYPD